MDYNTFKLIHSELIMSVQYIEQDLRIVYATIMPGGYQKNFEVVNNSPLGRILKKLHEMDEEVGFAKIKEEDYQFLDQIREIRNYWCHQCYIDFHYIEDPAKHDEAFQKIAKRLHYDENRVYDLQQRIEKLRKSVVKKYKYKNKG